MAALVRGAAGETRQHPDGAGLGEVGSRESAREGATAPRPLGAAQLGRFSLILRRGDAWMNRAEGVCELALGQDSNPSQGPHAPSE